MNQLYESQKRQPARRNRDELEFLPGALEILETPPRPAARMTALTISVCFLAALTWSILGRIDTVAVAQGQLVTTERVKLVQPLESSIIRAIRVHDGQKVAQGETLVELDPTEAQANLESLNYDLIKARLEAASAAAILTDTPAESFVAPEGADPELIEATKQQMVGEWEKIRATLDSIDADIEELEAAVAVLDQQQKKLILTLPIVEDRLATLEDLLARELARKPDVLQVRQNYIEMKSEVESNKANQIQGMARLDSRVKKRVETATGFRADNLQKRTEALRKIATLEQQVHKEERKSEDRRLRAPVSGMVFGLSVHTVGGVVATKDTLMRIVPEGSQLEAEIVVLNRDIGFVEEGQAVEIKLETFPFTRFGLVPGRVKEVSRDAIQDEKQGFIYKAVVTLLREDIQIDGKRVLLAPGMSVQAEIKTGDRRVIEFFLSPFIRYRDESLRER